MKLKGIPLFFNLPGPGGTILTYFYRPLGPSGPAQASYDFNGGSPIETVSTVNTVNGLASTSGFGTATFNYFTIALRYKPTSATPSASLQLFGGDADPVFELIHLNTNAVRFRMGGSNFATGTGMFTAGVWNSVVFSGFIGTGGWGGKIFVNGTLQGTQAWTGPSIDMATWWSGKKLRLGHGGSLNVGKICQFALYTNQKSDAVCQAFNALNGSEDVTENADWVNPFFYIRGVDTDDLAAAAGVQNFGTSSATFTWKGNNMTNAANLSTDVPT